MALPFTTEEFFGVFARYNQAIWPAQIVAYLLAILVLVLLFRPSRPGDRFIAGVLALFWIWTGAAYHLIYFGAINPAARLFAVVFIAQGIVIAFAGMVNDRLRFGHPGLPGAAVGGLFIAYAMLIYPLLGNAFGHVYPASPVFGVAPCPMTIFTFGVFLCARSVIPWYLYLLPLLWSLVGMSAAVNLRVPQDYGLVVAGIVGTGLILYKNRRIGQPKDS